MADNDDHRAQVRENIDPKEIIRPIPMTTTLVTLGMVIFGVVYLFMSEPLTTSRYGDQRTLADLSRPLQTADGDNTVIDGKTLYVAQCAACHQVTGLGVPGVFPPLDNSEWVQGEPRILANILLHGVSGEIEIAGQKYQGLMPAFSQLSDAELARVATYIRSAWSNKADAVAADLFKTERQSSAGRTTPFEGGAALKALSEKNH